MLQRNPDVNYVQTYHGQPHKDCRAQSDDLISETWHRGQHSVDMEWLAAKARVDDPEDHTVYCTRQGPDVGEETRYPAWKKN